MTKAQGKALQWLKEHGGSGALSHKRGKKQYLVAGGETAPFMLSTWEALEIEGLVIKENGRVIVK